MIARALLTRDPKSKALYLVGVDHNLFTRLELFRPGGPRNVLIDHMTGKEVRTIKPTFSASVSQDGRIDGDIPDALREHLVTLDDDAAIYVEYFYKENPSPQSGSDTSGSSNPKAIESNDKES